MFSSAKIVALRKESVDRNASTSSGSSMSIVALRKESVDRNKYVVQCRKMMGVALRKESVDRNIQPKDTPKKEKSRSPQGERG